MNKYIPLSIPNFEGNEKKYVNDALDQGWVSTGGAYITKLEKDLANYLNVDNVVACQSGTSALHLSLIEAGVEPGDTVLVSPLTFIAAVNPIKYQFAYPVFIDCDDSFCIDPQKLLQFCENECDWDGNNLHHNDSIVKAVIVVHVFGNMADMEAIMLVANKYNLIVIEDATEALGTHYIRGKYKGRFAGTIGDFGAYSFNGNKIITTGGGGAVTANKTEVADHMRYLSTQAKNDAKFYVHDEIGYNYRMTNLQAALGVAQMEELPEFVRRKNENYELYMKEFAGVDLVKLAPFRDEIYSNRWLYSLIIDRNRIITPMREIVSKLDKIGIQTRAIWGLISEQKPYKDCERFKVEKATYYSNCVLNIPSSTQITHDEISYVAYEIKRLLKEMANG